MTDHRRSFDRTAKDIRPVTIEVGVNRYAEGSCLISIGHTKVHCTASVERGVPPFMKGKGEGWVTAEYSMLPRATHDRSKRDRERTNGRTIEIQRLIGRALRVAIDFKKLGEQTIMLDCDVLQADGGTRCASITGAYVALGIAVRKMLGRGDLAVNPLIDSVAAISVGMRGGMHLLDLDYEEDSSCDVDMNVIMTGKGKFVEVQGTAEKNPFDQGDLDSMLKIGASGIVRLTEAQNEAIERGLKF